ncbi:hypothetical protein Tco_0555708 [Tanacetum coccineum]
MNTTQAQQKALDDALVSPSDRIEFRKCNMRLKTDIKLKEATFQVVLDAFNLTPFYRAFLITIDIPAIYMQEFWAIVFVHKSSIRFTINKKKVSLDVDIDLRHTRDITYLTDVNVDYLHQPWRAFAAVINKCLSGKETGMDKIRLSHVQILWARGLSPHGDHSTIPEKESDEVIKSSVEDLFPIPSESEDTSGSDSKCDLPSCNDFSPINISEEKSVTFSNPLFDLNDDFTSSDDESLSVEDVPEDNVKIYLNPLFEFDDEYISSDVNPLYDEVLEDIESEDFYVSKLDDPDLLVTPLSKLNEDECFNPGGNVDEIELLLHRDPSTPKISVASILEGFTDEPLLEENDDLFDLESKENEWKKILIAPDFEDSRAHGFVHRSLDLQSLASSYMGIRYPRSY